MRSLLVYSDATFSQCRLYRHTLWRKWSEGPTLNMLMLNPSKADAEDNDPTVARQITRAQMLGMGSLVVTNIFDFIATAPADMKRAVRPSSACNDLSIFNSAANAYESRGLVVCAWGKNGTHRNRSAEVRHLLRSIPLHALKITSGEPWHPLYLPYSLQPFLMEKY